ncbi:MAG: NAD(P)-binding domain-containing protein [Bacteroidetes bacterium]|nr:NAD(P)-binding domain-containing protein [Bacteroidota bacterium]
MELLLEKVIVYSLAALLCLLAIWFYLWKQKRNSKIVEEKILKAREQGLYEPVSLHPVVDENKCIKTGACIAACPEKDILGIRNGKATTINASRCIGHGACFHACPTKAITLYIGTEKRGVDLPDIRDNFETNVPGIFIAGELGGMGLIKNSVSQGQQVVDYITKVLKDNNKDPETLDLIIVGAGPAGIAASLTAKKHNLRFIVFEQDTLGGTVFTFPRSKIVMTSAMNLPLYGKVKLLETSKSELLELWKEVLQKNDITIRENTKIESITKHSGHFKVETLQGENHKAKTVLLAIGRRGSPRKLGIPGESLEKVAYRLLEPEEIKGTKIVVVGGGDAAVESALLLADHNQVILSYRNDAFSRIKPKNNEAITQAMNDGKLEVRFNSELVEIADKNVVIASASDQSRQTIPNDLVYIFAGGELPTQFLQKIGIQITTKFGEAILKH